MTISLAQQYEIDKYNEAYKDRNYRMGVARMRAAVRHLQELPVRGSLLDIGAGRGEMVIEAMELGFSPAKGMDPATFDLNYFVDEGLATNIPAEDNQYDVVTCFDVMEHLLKEDHIPALYEMNRVAAKYVVIAAADFPHENYHISYMPDDDWEFLFTRVFSTVTKLPRYGGISSTWLCNG